MSQQNNMGGGECITHLYRDVRSSHTEYKVTVYECLSETKDQDNKARNNEGFFFLFFKDRGISRDEKSNCWDQKLLR